MTIIKTNKQMKVYKLVFSPIEVNTYIIADKSRDCAIIDCGCYNNSEFDQLVHLIEAENLRPVMLLNTHCHLDHVFGNKFILEKYNLKSHSSELEEMNRKNSVQHSMLFGLNMEVPPEPESFITDGKVMEFGNIRFVSLHVPGHTAGSMAFYSAEDGTVFTGDALFSGSIGRTDLPGGSYDTLISSIKNKLFTLPPATIVYPGHGNQTTIEKEMRSNPFFN
jgi:hydroxyacylglutathione hydrolase